MPGTATDSQRAWVERVPGVSLGPHKNRAATGPKPQGGKVALMQARLKWDSTRKRVQAELQAQENAVLADCTDEPDFDTIKGNAKILYTVLDYLDARLIDKLDEVLNAEAGPVRKKLTDEAREIINEYTDYIGSDRLLHDIDDNGFVDLAIVPTVTQALQAIDAQLKVA